MVKKLDLEGKEEKEESVVPEAMQAWNQFVLLAIQTKEAWKRYEEKASLLGSPEVEKFPISYQLTGSRFRRGSFEVMFPRIIDYYRGNGGLDGLVAKV